MGKIIRRVVAILLAITALIIAILPAKGADATTKVHEEYEYDFQIVGTTVVKYLGNDPRVTLPNWVRRVGKGAFENNQDIIKIVLPDSVREIDSSAFENCKNLQVAVIPDSVRTIGPNAFSGCSNLYLISLPEKLKYIGPGAFANCQSLSQVNIDALNKDYVCVDSVIYSKDGKELVQYLAGRPYTAFSMPDTVEKIDQYAFYGSKNLKKVSISAKADIIPEYSFANCSGLSKVGIPYGIETISAYAFMDCDSLSSINIPDSVGYIDKRAFYLTDKTLLRFIDQSGNLFKEFNTLVLTDDTNSVMTNSATPIPSPTPTVEVEKTSEVINETVEMEAMGAQPAELLAENNILENVEYSEQFTIASGEVGNDDEIINYSSVNDSLESSNFTSAELGSTVIVGGNAMVFIPSDTGLKDFDLSVAEKEDEYNDITNGFDEDKTIISNGLLAQYRGQTAEYTVPAEVKELGARSFYENIYLQNITLPSNLQTIGDFAFARSAINSITIPNGTKKIGYGAFYYCANLSDVKIPASVETIELGAFDGTLWLDNWKNQTENGFLIAGDGILLAYKGNDSHINIPDIVKTIGAGAFANNPSITSVNIPSNVKTIDEDAFNSCVNLSEVKIDEGVTNINDRAFKNTAISFLIIPDSVSNIGLGAFDMTGNGNKLKTVMFVGKDLPNVSYKDTATRLSSKDLRKRVFEGVPNAIVEEGCDLDSGNILNPTMLGFNGQTYNIDSKAKNYTLNLLRATTLPDQNGLVLIDPHVRIGDFDYIMGNVKEHAFDYYNIWNEWAQYQPREIKVNGNNSNDLINLLSTTVSNIPASNESNVSGIKVNLNGDSFLGRGEGFAVIEDYDGNLLVDITEDSTIKDEVIKSYYNKFNTYPNYETVYLSIDLYDSAKEIPLKKLGDNKIEITIPLPMSFDDKNGIRIASLDENGILTELSSDISYNNNIKNIKFVTGYCNKLVIYTRNIFENSNNEAELISGDELVITDVVIDNNNYSTSNDGNIILNTISKPLIKGIETRWFVVALLLCFSGLLLSINASQKKKKNKWRILLWEKLQ